MRFLLTIALLINTLPINSPARATAQPNSLAMALSNAGQETGASTPTATPTPDAELEEAKRAAQLAEEERKREVSEKEAAEARAGKLKAIVQPFGAPNNVSVPTGNVQTDAAGWAESQALAQEGARQITLRMSKYLCQNPKDVMGGSLNIKTLVIYNAGDIAATELYESIIRQLEVLKKEFDQKHTEALKTLAETDPLATTSVGFDPTADAAADGGLLSAFAVPGAATSIIKSVAELINLFRTDTQFVNQSVAISEDTVVSYIADYLSGDTATATGQDSASCLNKFYIYYPLYMPAKPMSGAVGETCPGGPKNIVMALDTIGGKRLEAAADLKRIEDRIENLTKLGATVKERKEKIAAKTEKEKALRNRRLSNSQRSKLKQEIQSLSEAIAKLTETIKGLSGKGNLTDEELKTIESNSEKFDRWKKKLGDLKAKTELLITSTEQLLTKLNTPGEGNNQTALGRLVRAENLLCITGDKNSFTLRIAVSANGTTKIKKNLFVDAKVRHSARAGLVYQLFDNLGRVVKGSTMQCYIDYHSAQKVREAVSGTGSAIVCLTNADNTAAVEATNRRENKSKNMARAAQ